MILGEEKITREKHFVHSKFDKCLQQNTIFFRYFFMVFTGLIVLTLFNGLIFLPVLLVLIGPPAELIPNDNSEAIEPPSPEINSCSKSKHHHSSSSNRVRKNPLHHVSTATPSSIKINTGNNGSNLGKALKMFARPL